MEQVELKGTLPVALKVLVGQDVIISKAIVMRQMTAIEYLQAQSNVAAGQFISIADLASMTKLVDEDGTEHAISYDMLGHSSRANLDYLGTLREELDAKERADNTALEPELSEH